MSHDENQKPIAFEKRYTAALCFAAEQHCGQQRKGTTIPYITHPVAVADLLMQRGFTDDIVIAALLHDVVEDRPVSIDRLRGASFGERVANLVSTVTEQKQTASGDARPWLERKEQQLAAVRKGGPDAVVLKWADALHNAQATLRDLGQVGPTFWSRFKVGRTWQVWWYLSIADIVRDADRPDLASELEQAVAAIIWQGIDHAEPQAPQPPADGDADAGFDARYAAALRFAAKQHCGQQRKGTTIPYITHPVAVADLLMQHGFTGDVVIAALLHDVVEDSSASIDDVRGKFGDYVASLVSAVTEQKRDESGAKRPWLERKQEQIAAIGDGNDSNADAVALKADTVALKWADTMHNAQSTLRDLEQVGASLWSKFKAGRTLQVWWYLSIADVIRQSGRSDLAGALEQVVGAIIWQQASHDAPATPRH